jgi:hypothetical protein
MAVSRVNGAQLTILHRQFFPTMASPVFESDSGCPWCARIALSSPLNISRQSTLQMVRLLGLLILDYPGRTGNSGQGISPPIGSCQHAQPKPNNYPTETLLPQFIGSARSPPARTSSMCPSSHRTWTTTACSRWKRSCSHEHAAFAGPNTITRHNPGVFFL